MEGAPQISDNSRRIARNTLALYSRMLILMVIGLFTARIVLGALGIEDRGVYDTVGSFVSMMAIVTSSLSTAISRFLTVEIGKGDTASLKKVFATANAIMLIVAAVVILIAEPVGLWYIDNVMNLPDGRLSAARWVFQFSLATFVINMLSVPYNATIIAHEMGVNIRITSGPAIEKPGDLAALLTNLEKGDVLFIDEIHRLSRQVEEVLYPALEDYALDIIMGKGPAARSIRIDLNKFTLIGATTRAGQLTSPLRDRFGVIQRLELYSTDQLSDIVKRSANILGVPCDTQGAAEIAARSRGTPRIANRLLKRVRDFADVMGNGRITQEIAKIALNQMDVDPLGLDSLDRRMLQMIINGYGGGPVGLETLASAIGEESVTLEDVCEPYLMQLGFISRTPRGRCATELAYRHLGILKDGQTTF